jgi:hypothetical protein
MFRILKKKIDRSTKRIMSFAEAIYETDQAMRYGGIRRIVIIRIESECDANDRCAFAQLRE